MELFFQFFQKCINCLRILIQRLNNTTCICRDKLWSPWRIKFPMWSMAVQFNFQSLSYRQETEHNTNKIVLLIHKILSESRYTAHCSFWGEWFAKTASRRRYNFARSSLSDVKANFMFCIFGWQCSAFSEKAAFSTAECL